MEQIKQLEKTIEGWLKPLPHLPAEWRKWLGENAWWITGIGVILSALGLLGIIGLLLTAMSFVGVATSIYGVAVTTVYTSTWYVATFVSLAFLVVTTVLSAMAVNPLRAMKKKGWDLLFMVFLINVASGVLGVVININAVAMTTNLIGVAIGAAISAYVIFELKSQYNGATVVHKAK
ncbi:MAG: hypothetical protein WAV01_01550 [Candidatus Saccharimonadales bacterium]